MSLINIAQIAVSVLIIILVLLQERSSDGGGIFGGVGGGYYQARRGVEKIVYISTIILVAVFAALALLNLII